MISFLVIGFLVLLLAYFVMRSQNLQKKLNLQNNSLKSTENHNKYVSGGVKIVAGELQRHYVNQLEMARKSALINQQDGEILAFILGHFEFVVMHCCEQQATVEEAILKALEPSSYSMEQIRQFISDQPSEVRMPWCKNTIGGFVGACARLIPQR